jgi:Uma2 family endonuclease
MSLALAERYVSPEEYLAAERIAEEKSEYFDGRVVPMAGARRRHVRICENIAFALGVRLRDLGFDISTADMRVIAAGGAQYSYPDVVVADEYTEIEAEEDNLDDPILIVEVLSKSTEKIDRGEKLMRYKQIKSLKHCLLVSQTAHRIEHHHRFGNDWELTIYEGLDSTVNLDSLQCDLPLAEVYRKVTVGPYPPGSSSR